MGSTVTQKLTLFDDRWSRGRVVTSMDWSDQHPEMILASYNRAAEESSTDPNGLVLLWNTKLQKTTPDYILQAQVIDREIPYPLGKYPNNIHRHLLCMVELHRAEWVKPSHFQCSCTIQ